MFIRQLKTSLLTFLVLAILTGLVYPFFITGIAKFIMPQQAEGSLVLLGGKPVGSGLIGQPFASSKYFWGRLSATDTPYNASNSTGSNLGPLNPDLLKEVQGRIDALKKTDPNNKAPIPIDLVTSSASGLDPHISLAAAYYQVQRVAKARGVSEEAIRNLVRSNTEGRFLGILGEPVVNVLKLNLAVDNLK